RLNSPIASRLSVPPDMPSCATKSARRAVSSETRLRSATASVLISLHSRRRMVMPLELHLEAGDRLRNVAVVIDQSSTGEESRSLGENDVDFLDPKRPADEVRRAGEQTPKPNLDIGGAE